LPSTLPVARVLANGRAYSSPEMVERLDAHAAAVEEVEQLQVQLKLAIARRDALRTETKGIVTGLRGYLAAVFGETSSEYIDLGFEPKKPRTTTAAAQAAGVAKRAATRIVRKTMGKKQRKKIRAGVAPATPEPSETVDARTSMSTSPSPSRSTSTSTSTTTSTVPDEREPT
jgi:hypothetical protein